MFFYSTLLKFMSWLDHFFGSRAVGMWRSTTRQNHLERERKNNFERKKLNKRIERECMMQVILRYKFCDKWISDFAPCEDRGKSLTRQDSAIYIHWLKITIWNNFINEAKNDWAGTHRLKLFLKIELLKILIVCGFNFHWNFIISSFKTSSLK